MPRYETFSPNTPGLVDPCDNTVAQQMVPLMDNHDSYAHIADMYNNVVHRFYYTTAHVTHVVDHLERLID